MGFNDTWSDADPEGNNDNPPPNGLHDAALVDAGAFTSKGGNDVMKLEWQSVDRQHQWTQIGGFASQKAAGFTKGQAQKLGVDVDSVGSIEELNEALKERVGGFFEVEVERNGEYTNTYVRDGAVPDVPPDAEEPRRSTSDDPVPF